MSGFQQADNVTWQMFDAASIWAKEFLAALSKQVDALGWVQQMTWNGFLHGDWERTTEYRDPGMRIVEFPLQRGYHRLPFRLVAQLGKRQVARMKKRTRNPELTPLLCTSPFYAPVAELWPGPVVYYLTDLVYAYAGMDPKEVLAYDRRMCAAAAAVCPNSRRIAEYLISDAQCPASKIDIVPNATRQCNILPASPQGPGSLPKEIETLPRPIAGVIGNLAANMDWKLLEHSIDATPGFSWVLVGPTSMDVPDPAQRAARERLLQRGGRIHFTGPKPYGELQSYARCFDVAVLPYCEQREPTYSGSSTRFYEHLAACRPMLATRGFEELLYKEPLLRLVSNAGELAERLQELQRMGFQDGQEHARWEASLEGTWENRASRVVNAVETRYRAATSTRIVRDNHPSWTFAGSTAESEWLRARSFAIESEPAHVRQAKPART